MVLTPFICSANDSEVCTPVRLEIKRAFLSALPQMASERKTKLSQRTQGKPWLLVLVAVWDSRSRWRKENMSLGSRRCAFRSPHEWCILIILVLVRLRQEDCKFEANPSYQADLTKCRGRPGNLA